MEYEGTELLRDGKKKHENGKEEKIQKKKGRGRNRGVIDSKLIKERVFLNPGKTEGKREEENAE